jgi:hypothetical protein
MLISKAFYRHLPIFLYLFKYTLRVQYETIKIVHLDEKK